MSDYIRIDENTPNPPSPITLRPPPPMPPGPPLPPGPPMMMMYPPPPPPRSGWFLRIFGGVIGSVLIGSVMLNFILLSLVSAGAGAKVREDVFRAGDANARIALIAVDGLIDFTAADRLRVMLEQARKDATIKAVVLWVNSPGGYVTSSDEMFRAVRDFRTRSNKPVIVQMRGVAASGGYYLSAASDYIFAEPTTVTGSIGVVMQWFGADGFLKSHGVEARVFRSGDRKYRGGMFEKLDEKTVKEFEEMLSYDHKLFVDAVFEGRRNVPRDRIEAVATGAAYTAADALKFQLIDKVGYLDDALAHAAAAAGLTGEPAVVQYKPTSMGLLDLIGAGARAAEKVEGFDPVNAVNALLPRRMYLAALE
jgi:protease-4